MLRIGIDLGGTKTEGIVMDVDGNILHRERRPTPQAKGYAAILTNIQELVLDLERRTGETCRVGIGMPGAISPVTGLQKNSNTVCLNGMPVKENLEGSLARPIRIANDANCFAFSEALDDEAGLRTVMGRGAGADEDRQQDDQRADHRPAAPATAWMTYFWKKR